MNGEELEQDIDVKPICDIDLSLCEVLDSDPLKFELDEQRHYYKTDNDDIVLVSDDELENYESPKVEIKATTEHCDSNTVSCVLCQARCDAKVSFICNSCQANCLENALLCLDEADHKPSSCREEDVKSETRSEEDEVNECEDSPFLTTISYGLKTYYCQICLQNTTNISHMRMHMDTHTKLSRFRCTQCSFCCTYKSDLIKHTYAHILNSKIWQSTEGVMEREAAQLRATVVDGRKIYCCQNCPYETSSRTMLRKHLISHAKIKAFKCSQCLHCYSKVGDLKTHMGSHPVNNKDGLKDLPFLSMKVDGQTSYFCKICQFNTIFPSNIRRHINSHTVNTVTGRREEDL